MKVILIRHGKPEFDKHFWVKGKEARKALLTYAESRVTLGPDDSFTREHGALLGHLMTSNLPRAIDSQVLCNGVQAEVSELLNEAALPHPHTLWVPLRWTSFIVICRLAWLVGYKRNADGFQPDKRRAREACAILAKRASEHGTVYAFGHGIMNRLIGQELKRQGWKIQSQSGHGYR